MYIKYKALLVNSSPGILCSYKLIHLEQCDFVQINFLYYSFFYYSLYEF